MNRIYTIASTSLLLSIFPNVASAAIFQQTFAEFNGTFDSVNLPIGGELIPTGVISATQNTDLPSVVTFDTETNETVFDLNFLLDFPLLDNLELEPLATNPFVTGTFAVDGDDLITDGIGESTIDDPTSPFLGTLTVFDVQWRVTSPLDSPVFLGEIISEVVTICLPSSPCVQTIGTGEATSDSASVPEPSFGLVFLFVGILGTFSLLKNKFLASVAK